MFEFLGLSALPQSAAGLIGRGQEIAALVPMITGRSARHISLIGPPGVGKTRLAIEVARTCSDAFRGGAVFVDLAPVDDPGHVVEAIARRLEVPEVLGADRFATLAASLSNRDVLLVLDNLEQIADAAPLVPRLLDACVNLVIVTTSRTALRVMEKHELLVTALDLPGVAGLQSPDAVARTGSVQLFVERAAAARNGFQLSAENCRVVAEICIRLEGLPLAIEMAAARISHLTPWEILDRLDQRLQLLRSRTIGVPDRHRSLWASLEWSFGLLSPPQQRLIRRLAVFRGGFDLGAAEYVAGFDGIAAAELIELLGDLVEHSLVVASPQSTVTRYWLLESVREFARSQLDETGEVDLCETRHLDWYVALAEEAEPRLYRSSQVEWLDRLDRDHDNIIAALATAVRPGAGDLHRISGLRLAAALERYWYASENVVEGRRWLSQLCTDSAPESPVLAKALATAFHLAMLAGEASEAAGLAARAVDVARASGDLDALGMALSLFGLAQLNSATSGAPLDTCAEALAILDQLGSHRRGQVRFMCAEAARGADFEAEASDHIRDGLAVLEDIGDIYGMLSIETSGGLLALQRRDLSTADELFGAALNHALQLKSRYGFGIILEFIAWTASARADTARAARFFGAADAARRATGASLLPRWMDLHDQYLRVAALAYGPAQFETLWNEGASVRPEELAILANGTNASDTPGAAYDAATPRRIQAQASGLTVREIEVLQLVAAGRTNRQIAQELVISVRTVERHITNLYTKIGARGKADATAYAFRHSLISR